MTTAPSAGGQAATFEQDVVLAGRLCPLVILETPEGAGKAAVAPTLQGRVLTSTTGAGAGRSLGWINRELFASGRLAPRNNAYGGEDRLWLGPEGGQFSIFFAPGAPFEFDRWTTPAGLDTEPATVIAQTLSSVVMRSEFRLINHSRAAFDVRLDREVWLPAGRELWRELGMDPVPGLAIAGFTSRNRLANAGTAAWRRETGLLSLWVLGQFPASPSTVAVIPFRDGQGDPVRTDYFGAIPPERFQVRGSTAFFRCDARRRGKLGLSQARATGRLGSYDAASRVLTVVSHTLPQEPQPYVNSAWEIQKEPYAGDAANSYNDGPLENGQQLGAFYELESSSPAAALEPGGELDHTHSTIHLEGPEEALDAVARHALGVGIGEIAGTLGRG